MFIEENMKNEIKKLVKNRLKRDMTSDEIKRVLRPRSLIAYEMIIDQIKDNERTFEEIELYIKNID